MTRARVSMPRVLRILGGRFGPLLVALIALILTAPVAASGGAWALAVSIFAAAVLVASLYAAWPRRRSLAVGLALAATDVGISGLASVVGDRGAVLLQISLWLLTLVVVTAALVEAILATSRVTADTILAALCVYILLVLSWAYLYALIERLAPGTFLSPSGLHDAWSAARWRRTELNRLLGFSFGAMTAVGDEGLRTPRPFAHLLACLEAMTGQVYLAVLVARLVGMNKPEAPQ